MSDYTQREDDFEEELDGGGGIEILPIVNLLLRNMGSILKNTGLLALAVGCITLFIPPTFTATVKFLPSDPANQQMRGQYFGPSMGITEMPPTSLPEYYQVLLQSASLLEAVAKRHLKNHPETITNPTTRLAEIVELLRGSSVVTNKSSVNTRIQILDLGVNTPDPNLSVELANELIDELSAYGGQQRNYNARLTRDFIQKRVDESEATLRTAENKLSEFALSNRRIDLPDIQAEKERLERAVEMEEESYKSLRKQLDIANIKALEDVQILQVFERPDRAIKTAPQRGRILLIITLLGLLFFSLLILLRDRWQKIDRDDPEVVELVSNMDNIRTRTQCLAGLAWHAAHQSSSTIIKAAKKIQQLLTF
jgi:uncharacterized protein involved in exopolysaccharide biosynthesis